MNEKIKKCVFGVLSFVVIPFALLRAYLRHYRKRACGIRDDTKDAGRETEAASKILSELENDNSRAGDIYQRIRKRKLAD